jgi:hypothetical protein
MYNPYHLWGFLSTFNADAINHIEITKGACITHNGEIVNEMVKNAIK